MNGYIDFNSEILAGADHPDFLEKSEEILSVLKSAKIKTVVSTSRFDEYDDLEKYLAERKAAYDKLSERIKGKSYPKIILGSEVVFSENLINISEINRLCIGNTRYIMMTLPEEGYSDNIYNNIQKLIISKNICPIVAHIEKYVDSYSLEYIKKLSSLGILMQVSCQAIVNRATRRMALELLNNGTAQIIGSDNNIMKQSDSRTPGEVVMDVLNKDITTDIADVVKPLPQYADAVRIMRYNLRIGKYKQIKNNAGMVISNATLKDIMMPFE